MKTDPQKCEVCKYRFACFTERTKENNSKISSTKTPKLSDILKELQVKFSDANEPRITNN